MKRTVGLTCAFSVLLLSSQALADPPANADAAKVAPAAKKKEAKRPAPYNEQADAKADLQKALHSAKATNRRVLIQWGGNWCSWCVLLHERFNSDAALRQKLLYEYIYLPIDIGRSDRNQDLVTKFHADLKSNGVPYLTILDADGKVLVNQATEGFETKSPNGHDPKKLLEFLTQHQAKPQSAEEALRIGFSEAKQSKREVLLHFGAPWCGWCRRMEAWMDTKDIAPLLSKEFVDVKIDIDRMDGGKAVLQRYREKDAGGIPWFVFLSGDGKVLATSDGPKGNVGFPVEEEEIAHFLKMLESAREHLSQADIDHIAQSLREERKRLGQ